MCSLVVRFLKLWTLPVAITTGIFIYFFFSRVAALSEVAVVAAPAIDRIFPLSVFLTLWATFCKVDFHAMRPARWAFPIMAVQMAIAALLIIILMQIDGTIRLVGIGLLACVIAPCATAAPVVTAKLGGNVNRMTAYVLLSSVLSSIAIPIVSVCFSEKLGGNIGSLESTLVSETPCLQNLLPKMLRIFSRVATIMLLPLALGYLVRHYVKPLHRWVVAHTNLPFYLWAFSLTITTGVTVQSIDHSSLPASTLAIMAIGSLIVCLLQFGIGHYVGTRSNHRMEAGQALGQKNTALIIWATVTFLHPAVALAPGCYVLWQNIVNSIEIHKATRSPLKKRQVQFPF